MLEFRLSLQLQQTSGSQLLVLITQINPGSLYLHILYTHSLSKHLTASVALPQSNNVQISEEAAQ